MAKNVEKRFVDAGFEVRSEEGKPITVSGYAAVFEDETVIGGAFAERVARGAFEGSDMSNTVALFNHDMNQPLARVGHGLDLKVDERGLRYSFELGNQSYAKDLAENIRMGNVSTSSFGFTVEDDEWERRSDGMNLRTINKVGLLFDVSPTTQGAYPTTEVGLRSMELALANEEVLEIENQEVREELENQEQSVEEVVEEVREQMTEEEETPEEEVEERPGHYSEEEMEEEEEERSESPGGGCGCGKNENPEPEARNSNISNSNEMKENNPAPAIIQGMGDTEGKLKKRYSFGKAIQEAAAGRLTGLEAEMSQEARNEYAEAKVNVNNGGFSVPSMMLRATDDPLGVGASSDGVLHQFGGTIGTVDNGFVAAFRPNDIATQMGARTVNGVSGNIVFQVQNAEVDASKPAEGAAGTLDNADFTSVTLTPARYAAYTAVSEQLMAQSADDMGAFIAADIRKAIDEKFNADVVAAIDAAADSSAGGTITADLSNTNAEALTALLGLEGDLLAADVPLENIRALAGATAYRTARQVSMDTGSGLMIADSPLARRNLLGYDAVVNSSVTAANIYLADASNLAVANWGGLNIMVDPYTFAEKGVIRIITNVYKDVKVLNGAGFVGLSSFNLTDETP